MLPGRMMRPGLDMGTPRFLVVLVVVSLFVFALTNCARAMPTPQPVTPAIEPTAEPEPSPSPTTDQPDRDARRVLRAAVELLLTQPSVYVTSEFSKTTRLTMKAEGDDKPLTLVFSPAPVKSRGYFIRPGTFQVRQRAEPPNRLSALPDGRKVTVEPSEWWVGVTDGTIDNAADTGLASVLRPSTGDLLAQFLSISLTGATFSGDLNEYVTFDSADFVAPSPEEAKAAMVVEARRAAITGGTEVWRFAIDHDTRLLRISVVVEPLLVSAASVPPSGSSRFAFYGSAVLTIVPPPIEVPSSTW